MRTSAGSVSRELGAELHLFGGLLHLVGNLSHEEERVRGGDCQELEEVSGGRALEVERPNRSMSLIEVAAIIRPEAPPALVHAACRVATIVLDCQAAARTDPAH